MLTYDPEWIVEHINDLPTFAKDLARAAARSIETGDLSPMRECLLNWEATAEVNAIPGMRENIVAGYQAIRQGEDQDLRSWKDFLSSVGVDL